MTRKFGRMVPKWSVDDIEAQCEEVLNLDYSNWTKNMALWGSCAQQDGAGFWYNRCSAGNLNGEVDQTTSPHESKFHPNPPSEMVVSQTKPKWDTNFLQTPCTTCSKNFKNKFVDHNLISILCP